MSYWMSLNSKLLENMVYVVYRLRVGSRRRKRRRGGEEEKKKATVRSVPDGSDNQLI